VKGNYKKITQLPKYVDVNEWVAVNVSDFYTNLNEFYGVLTECCTNESCPTMSAGPNVNYLYSQAGGSQKRVSLSAPGFIDATMSRTQGILNNPEVFPTNSAQEFHPSFPSTIRGIYRDLLRVFAHIYHAHYPQILHLRFEPHFNSLFAHYLAFGREYQLLDEKDIKGKSPDAQVGVGLLWMMWREKGILE
jgi:MOB kinase activator 1